MSIEYPNQARQEYGPVDTISGVAGSPRVAGVKKQIVIPFTYLTLPTPADEDDNDAVYQSIPANSLIVAAYGLITTDFNSTSGTTVVDVGTELADGTDVDLDGLIDDFGGAADGSNAGWYVGAGADVGAQSHATLPVFVKMTPSVDDLTAGAGKIIVEYIESGV